MNDVYLNPLTDFGFKKLFGEEPNKDLLISFLNSLLPTHHQVQDLTYTKNEYQGVSVSDRKAIFDLNCISPTGERFVVELQRVKQVYFKDRSIYYATFPIQEQAQRGDWNYKLSAVYTIGILDFLMDDHESKVFYHAQLKDQDNHLFYDKLNFIYLVLPRFQLDLGQLETMQQKWLYIFRHLHELDQIPEQFQEEVFQRLFGIAKIAQLPSTDRQGYERSLKEYRDFMNSRATAYEEGYEEGELVGIEKGKQLGLEEGEIKGKQKTALKMLAKGMDITSVAELLELPIGMIQAWQRGED